MQGMATELFFKVRNRWDGLFTELNTNQTHLRGRLTPPSLIQSGATPHSSLIEPSKNPNHSSSSRPSHQSALWFIFTSIELGDLKSENVPFKDSHKFSVIVSRFWSGTIRTDTCDFTREGITVGSE